LAEAGTISVLCQCGKKLKAPSTAVGKKAKCPKCGNIVVVKLPPPPPEDDGLDALYDLAQESEQAAANQEFAPRCPGCFRELPSGAVLCTNCGYDTRSGKSIKPKVETLTSPAAMAVAQAKQGKKGKPVDMMAPQGSFLKGLAASIGAASAGAIVWFLIAWGTGYEIYFVVLGIGALAGLGMQWGQEGYSYLGGFTAAAVTFVVMVLARIAVVVALLLPMMRAEEAEEAALQMPDLEMYDERVVEKLHEDELKVMKVEPGDEDKKQNVAAYQAVEKKLKAMPKAQYNAMVAKFDQDEREQELAGYLTEDLIKKQFNVHPDSATGQQWEMASKQAKEKMASMTQAQKDAEHKKLAAAEEKELQEQIAKAKAERAARKARGEDDGSGAAAGAAAAIGFVFIMFLVFGGFKGFLFTLGALFLAYRSASGSVSDS
jgi:hypothetical protein